MPEASKSIAEIEKEILSEFEDFFDWKEKYQYIIEMGSELPGLGESDKNEANRVHGCQSQVWLTSEKKEDGTLLFHADSDSVIVKGILALILRLYSGQKAENLRELSLDFFDQIGLSKHLSMNRSNGLVAMLNRIRQLAQG